MTKAAIVIINLCYLLLYSFDFKNLSPIPFRSSSPCHRPHWGLFNCCRVLRVKIQKYSNDQLKTWKTSKSAYFMLKVYFLESTVLQVELQINMTLQNSSTAPLTETVWSLKCVFIAAREACTGVHERGVLKRKEFFFNSSHRQRPKFLI